MLAGGASRLVPGHYPPRLVHWRFMALKVVVLRPADRGSIPFPFPFPFSPRDESRGITRKIGGDLCVGVRRRGSSRGVLTWRNCLDRREGVFRRAEDGLRKKAHAVAPYSASEPLIRGSELRLEDAGRAAEVANGRASPLGFLNHVSPERLVVAVDVDEVLGRFLAALNEFTAEHYSASHSLSEFYVYEFFRIWKCSRKEADTRVHEFFKTAHFKRGIQPIPGARRVLDRLSAFCHLSVVTSRQNVIREHTVEWIEEHYPGLFREVHFGNHFALDGESTPKSEICRRMGARVLIDDNPRYAVECAEAGISVLLFDYGNSYPWSKCPAAAAHPLVTTVHTWDQVERAVLSLAAASSP